MTDPYSTPPDLADLEAMAHEALRSIPDVLRSRVADVVIRIDDFPDTEIQREMGLQDPFELLGLYRGVPLDEKSISDAPQDIDTIYLFRRPLLDYWCETGEDLTHLVRHVLIHEIGHHFGFYDDDMERLEQ
ncbi:MAG: metallopeptidase family protein, partial [Proteobacteria bacterium]|nr:metallopeptidase family protein [Pseudomonadota bacterium]